MKRRDFLRLAGAVGAAATWPVTARAQQSAQLLALASSTVSVADMTETGSNANWRSFLSELRRQGVVEGQNTIFERYFQGVTDADQLGQTIAATRPDLIFVGASTPLAQAVATAAPKAPVVFLVGDALAGGLVTNLAHPGGNLTGVNTTAGVEAEAVRIELLREAVPNATRDGYLDVVAAYEPLGHRPVVEMAAVRLGLTLIPAIVDRPYENAVFEGAVADLNRQGIHMLNLANSSPLITSAALLASLARAARLPACGPDSSFVDAGGLMSYGADLSAIWARAATYVVEILGGARPGDLPVQQPETFQLVVNLKAASELGLEVPSSLLVRATDVRKAS